MVRLVQKCPPPLTLNCSSAGFYLPRAGSQSFAPMLSSRVWVWFSEDFCCVPGLVHIKTRLLCFPQYCFLSPWSVQRGPALPYSDPKVSPFLGFFPFQHFPLGSSARADQENDEAGRLCSPEWGLPEDVFLPASISVLPLKSPSAPEISATPPKSLQSE